MSYTKRKSVLAIREVVEGNDIHVVGHHNTIKGKRVEVDGHHNKIYGDRMVVAGHHNYIKGDHANVTGHHNTVQGRYAKTVGQNNTVLAPSSNEPSDGIAEAAGGHYEINMDGDDVSVTVTNSAPRRGPAMIIGRQIARRGNIINSFDNIVGDGLTFSSSVVMGNTGPVSVAIGDGATTRTTITKPRPKPAKMSKKKKAEKK